jgi:hypothetical protein
VGETRRGILWWRPRPAPELRQRFNQLTFNVAPLYPQRKVKLSRYSLSPVQAALTVNPSRTSRSILVICHR